MQTPQTKIDADTVLHTDIIVVGSGAGGATTSKMLADAGRDVIMLEEGGYHSAEIFKGGVADLMEQLYRDGGVTPIMGRPAIPFAEGCCVGGTTVINGGVFWRTPGKILSRWTNEFGLPDVDEKSLAPHFEILENDFKVKFHLEPDANQASRLIVNGAEALGWRWSNVPRGQQGCQNSNRCPTGCPNNAKQSMIINYIPATIARGAQLIAKARVERVLMENDRAVGIRASVVGDDGRRHTLVVHAKTVFVCAGPMQTPFILRRSGLKGTIGTGLHLHLNLKAVAIFPHDIAPGAGTILSKQVKEFDDRDIYFGSSTFDPIYLALALAPHGPAAVESVMSGWRHAGIFVTQLKADGTGCVRTSPLMDRPLPFYRLTAGDLGNFRFAIEKIGEVLLAAGAQKIYLPIAGSGPVYDLAGVKRVAGGPINPQALDLVSVHALASCRLGRSLNAFGQVQGISGLYVNDASMLPEAPGVSPQMTIMALARRNVAAFLEGRNHA